MYFCQIKIQETIFFIRMQSIIDEFFFLSAFFFLNFYFILFSIGMIGGYDSNSFWIRPYQRLRNNVRWLRHHPRQGRRPHPPCIRPVVQRNRCQKFTRTRQFLS